MSTEKEQDKKIILIKIKNAGVIDLRFLFRNPF